MERQTFKVTPSFWMGKTGAELRLLNPAVRIVAIYLLTNPHANTIGFYYLPKSYISHDVGIKRESVKIALSTLKQLGFALYDEDNSITWVVEMADVQLGKLSPKDHVLYSLKEQINSVAESNLMPMFMERYADQLAIENWRNLKKKELSKSTKPTPLVDKAHIDDLKARFTWVDVDKIATKAAAWVSLRKDRQFTKRFLTNWVIRESERKGKNGVVGETGREAETIDALRNAGKLIHQREDRQEDDEILS